MSAADATAAPAAAPPVAATLSAVHTAIRRGSVLKAAPPPAAAIAAAERARLEYLREANEEAEALSNNAQLLHTLHRQASAEGIPPPPPPPPAESDSADSIPPPPPAPAAALLEDIANPLLRVSLAPVNPGALRLNDGLNPAQATMLAITSSARGPPQSKLRPVAVGPSGGLSASLVDSYLAEEAELEASLAANRGLVDALVTSGPPPAFPESAADLAEAQEAKRQEEEALVKMPAPSDDVVAASASSATSGAADKVVRARRNSKLLLHAELTKPLARLALNPVITEEKDIRTIVKEQQEAEAAAAAAEAAGAGAGQAAAQ